MVPTTFWCKALKEAPVSNWRGGLVFLFSSRHSCSSQHVLTKTPRHELTKKPTATKGRWHPHPRSKQKNTWRTLWRGCPVGKAGEHLQIQILHNHLVLHPLAHQTWHLHLWRKEANEVDVSPRALPRCKRVEGKTLSLLCPGSLSLKKNNLEETQVIDFLPCHYPCAKTSDTGVSKHVIKPCHIKSHHVVWRHHDLSHHLWTPPLNPQTSKAWGRWWNWGLHSSQPWQNPQTVARHPQRLLWRRRLA